MLEKETKELVISEELKRKVEIICGFANKKYTLTNGSLIGYKETNLAYVKPHILTIDNNDYLIFEEFNHVFIKGYENKILFKDLINNHKIINKLKDKNEELQEELDEKEQEDDFDIGM